jgi:predicted 3-demethylubiquinone-9 3-methyltransferase (glyoxalase superfamily)
MQKISPFLWFENQAEAAAHFYVSVFKQSRILDVMRYGDAGPGPKGAVMLVSFEIEGQKFTALNGNTQHPFDEAVSFYVDCRDQAEVDALWDRLTADGGAPIQCGWLRDKFGVRWQIVPPGFIELMKDPDPAKAARVMRAMMTMVKLDLAALRRAYDGA